MRTDEGMPMLRKQGTATQLIVDGRPFLILGGELHNSSSSSLEYMAPIWRRMLALNFNTVLAPVYWELIEPEEGRFDFALVDGLLAEARRHQLRLVLLWFGSWKNGMSSYVPLWVKRDYERFPRLKLSDGATSETLSTLSAANRDADARAFAALMTHLRTVDGVDHTVVMVQVENEVGVIGDSRDHSSAAEAAFAHVVPPALLDYLQRYRADLVPELRDRWESAGARTSGTWTEVFDEGPETDEIFMAWNYGRYVGGVAAAGKAVYPIPLFVNAWLPGPGHGPGEYPSGTPLPHVMDVWMAAGAGAIDFYSPDIYSPQFSDWCERYVQRGNPLFIPEMRGNENGARQVFYAVGQHAAMGVSPFAVDSIPEPADAPLSHSYAVLQQIAPELLAHAGAACGFLLDAETPRVERTIGGYILEISLDELFGRSAEIGYGLIIDTGDDTFLGAGSGFRVTLRPTTPGPPYVGIGSVDEGAYRDGQWIPGRRLNGDENDQGRAWRFSNRGLHIERCTVYRYA